MMYVAIQLLKQLFCEVYGIVAITTMIMLLFLYCTFLDILCSMIRLIIHALTCYLLSATAQ